MKSAFMVPIYLAYTKIKERAELDPRVRRREAMLKAPPETREVELTHSN